MNTKCEHIFTKKNYFTPVKYFTLKLLIIIYLFIILLLITNINNNYYYFNVVYG